MKRPLPSQERLIFALDVPSREEALRMIELLDDAVVFYKIGLELFTAGVAFELIDVLQARGKKIFLDLKLFDIPRTVGAAVKRLEGRGIDLLTVHAGDAAILESASAAAREISPRDSDRGLGILAVTVLTSIATGDEEQIRKLVLERACQARDAGCAGVVASGHEVEALRAELGDSMSIVVPGIRAQKSRPADDQKRTVDVEEAFEKGADFIVVGRPIRNAKDPRRAARAIQDRIAAHFRH